MRETRQMKGPCGLVIVPINQVPSYLARGFELYGPEPTPVILEPPKPSSKKKLKKSRQLLKTEIYGNNARKNQ